MSDRTAIIGDVIVTFAIGLLLRLTVYIFHRGVAKGRELNRN